MTDEQREVLTLAAEGMGYKEIAARLGISKRTVRRRVSHAYTNLGLEGERRNLITAILVAMKRGEIRPRGLKPILLV